MAKKRKEHKTNNEITATEVRVTDGGIMSLQDALALVESQELDLVLINEASAPPICKIMNYEKFIYSLNKKPKTKPLDLKEIKLGINISDNDLEYRKKHIIEFLTKGHRVKISLRLKGREAVYQDKAKAVMLKLAVEVENYGVAEDMPKTEGKIILLFIKPLVKK